MASYLNMSTKISIINIIEEAPKTWKKETKTTALSILFGCNFSIPQILKY